MTKDILHSRNNSYQKCLSLAEDSLFQMESDVPCKKHLCNMSLLLLLLGIVCALMSLYFYAQLCEVVPTHHFLLQPPWPNRFCQGVLGKQKTDACKAQHFVSLMLS